MIKGSFYFLKDSLQFYSDELYSNFSYHFYNNNNYLTALGFEPDSIAGRKCNFKFDVNLHFFAI